MSEHLKTNTPLFFALINSILSILPSGKGYRYGTVHESLPLSITAAYRRETTRTHEFIVKEGIDFLTELGVCVSYSDIDNECRVGIVEDKYLNEMQVLDARVKKWIQDPCNNPDITAVCFNESETISLLLRLNSGKDRSLMGIEEQVSAYCHRDVIEQSVARVKFETLKLIDDQTPGEEVKTPEEPSSVYLPELIMSLLESDKPMPMYGSGQPSSLLNLATERLNPSVISKESIVDCINNMVSLKLLEKTVWCGRFWIKRLSQEKTSKTTETPPANTSIGPTLDQVMKSLALALISQKIEDANPSFKTTWKELYQIIENDGLEFEVRSPIVSGNLQLTVTNFKKPISREMALIATSIF